MTLILHVTEVLVDIYHCDQWISQVVPIADALDPCGSGRETCCRMEVSDSLFYTGELVDVVDCFHC